MPDWFVEDGIGETRAIQVDQGEIVAARVDWPGGLKAGLVEDARLISRASGSSRGTAHFASGQEALVDRLPASASEGAIVRLRITRPAMAESRRLKRAHARVTDEAPRAAPSLCESLDGEVSIVRRFPVPGWDDLIAESFAGEISFSGGSLLLSATPAMTLIDIDGTLAPKALALIAVPAIAAALRRFDIGGSVGIDFPTLSAKEDRRAVDRALDDALADWAHERTAMNGFGFVQLVARLERVSLIHRVVLAPEAAAVRLLLRRAEVLEGAGALLLTGHPNVLQRIASDWTLELSRRTAREVRLHPDPGLAVEAAHAQLIAR